MDMPKGDRIFGMLFVIFMLSTALFLSGCIKSGEPLQKLSVPKNNESPIGQISEDEKEVDSNIIDDNIAVGAITGQGFNESVGVITKKWDSMNFSGFWRDPEENVSTETLTINQSLLNNSYRVIDKHNLIYRTNLVPFKYQIFALANRTPEGTDGSYQAIGWMGEKHVYLQGNKLAKIIFEQNTSDVKTLGIMESWNMGDGYSLIANSICAKCSPREAWFSLFKDKTKLMDEVLIPGDDSLRYTGLYIGGFMSYHPNNDSVPIFVTYFHRVYASQYTDAADLKYTWLRSQKTTEIKVGQIYGIMEVVSVDNGTIELRNREQIYLSPGNAINLMEDFNIQVGDSKTSLSFHPFRVIRSV